MQELWNTLFTPVAYILLLSNIHNTYKKKPHITDYNNFMW